MLLEKGDRTSGLTIPDQFFFVPFKDNSQILYLPAIAAAFLINDQTRKLFEDIAHKEHIELDNDTLATLNYFILNDIIVHASCNNYLPDKACSFHEFIETFTKNYAPTHITLCPTSDCNLRCIYCYASGGDEVKYMDPHLAKRAIDYLLNNAIRSKKDEVVLSFHGGGEPTMAFDLIETCVNYGREVFSNTNIELKIYLTTNLLVGRKQMDFIIENFDSVGVSFDGPEDIQNFQRPAANGQGSYKRTVQNIKELDRSGVEYHIRSTFLKNGIAKMEEITEFFLENFPNLAMLHYEPCGRMGRAEVNNLEITDWKDFAIHLANSKKLANKYNKRIRRSCSGIDETGNRFCGAVLDGFWVSLDGNVYSCGETLSCDNPIAHAFKIGTFDYSKDNFIMDFQTIKTLLRRDVDNMPHCKDCFAKYNCKGSCPARVMRQTGDYMNTVDFEECDFIRDIVKSDLAELLMKDEYKIKKDDYAPLSEPEKLTDSDIVYD